MSPPSRPSSASPDDIAKWEAEIEAAQKRQDEDRAFRETMLQFAARTDTTLTNMREDMRQHATEDLEQFRRQRRAHRHLARKVESLSGQVTQTVNTNRYNWGVAAAYVSAFVAIAGVGWALIEKFGSALKP